MANSLEERLAEHAQSFDGLLSLIPAKFYYDEQSDAQWVEKQRKNSPEEKRNAKRLKLDPSQSQDASVKQVLKEKEATAEPVVLPGEKWKKKQQQQQQQKEQHEEEEAKEDVESEELEIDMFTQASTLIFDDNGSATSNEKEEIERERKKVQKAKQQQGAAKPSLTPEEQAIKDAKQLELKAKLQEKIKKLREKRKAPGSKTPGAATSREQILEERRRKQEQRKQLKRKLEEEQDQSSSDSESEQEQEQEEAGQVMFSNIEFQDGDRLSSDLKTTRKLGKKKGPANNDVAAHLRRVERTKAHLATLDEDKQKKHAEKSKWGRAMLAVQGLKVKDDEKLLKKALKRKEATKRRSEIEWRDRKQAVADGIKARADRRDENLRIRKENKGRSKKHQIKHLPSLKGTERGGRKGKGKKDKKRAGFEGKRK